VVPVGIRCLSSFNSYTGRKNPDYRQI